jgi:hypothetical protein
MKVQLTVEIDYDVDAYADEAVSLAAIRDILHGSVERMVGEGGLSGNTSIEVDTWDARIKKVE